MASTQAGLVHPGDGLFEKVVNDWYPRLEERAYFVPPVHFNMVRYDTHHVGGQHSPHTDQVQVLVPKAPVKTKRKREQSVLMSDVQNDRTTQRLRACLRALAEEQNEVMFVLSQLDYGDYLGEPCYSAAVRCFHSPKDFVQEELKGKDVFHRGDFDILIFHREYGVLVGEVKTVGDNFSILDLTQKQQDAIVAKKVEQAVKQLNKAEKVLAHLLSDLQPPPRVRKSVMLPNIARSQLQRVLHNNPQLEEAVCQCMAVQRGVNPVDMCLCADELSNRNTPFDLTDDVMTKLVVWWRHVMTSQCPDTSFKAHYRSVVARFAGPATTIKVFSVSKPRLHVHTEGEAVSEIGRCFTQIILHPDQLEVLQRDQRLVHLLGPPGTGKTVVLVVRAVKWLQDGKRVTIISPRGFRSRAAACIIYDQVCNMTDSVVHHNLNRLHTDVMKDTSVKETLQRLAADKQGRNDEFFGVIDESSGNTDYAHPGIDNQFSKFCEELKNLFGDLLHLWVASTTKIDAPDWLDQVPLTESLRSPPVIVREIKQSVYFASDQCPQYREGSAPPPSDGPPVRRLYHTAGRDGHCGEDLGQCVQCGVDVCGYLVTDLRVGVKDASRPPRSAVSPDPLRYRDVLVVSAESSLTDDVTDPNTDEVVRPASGFVRGLRQGCVPVRVVKSGDDAAVEQMARMDGPDAVVAADSHVVSGIERHVVVLLGSEESTPFKDARFDLISRCSSQLVWVLPSSR
ncbi:uncharacterized protein [Littorina saxatilis]|uniref:uncharacterized protein n=1 Tax=Littorina saxatilis TaxID=31220 RepID=UPI0038B59A79